MHRGSLPETVNSQWQKRVHFPETFQTQFPCIPKERFYLPLLTIATVLAAGALGNFIDRFFRGYVIDFIYFSLIDFPVFNLADVYVVVSGIFLILFVCTKYRDDDFAFLNIKQ